MSINESTIDALLTLLEDQDELVFNTAKDKLLSLGSLVLPALEGALYEAKTPEHIQRLADLICSLRGRILIEQMKSWIENENRTLLDGWILISSIYHSTISRDRIESSIQKIYTDVWLEITDSMTSLEKVSVINHILFKINLFKISGGESPDIDTIVIDKLLFSKTGDVHSLTILYLLIARSLHLELLPIMLANKLLLVYEDDLATSLAFGKSTDKYLFYINVAHNGSVISPKEVQFLYDKSQKYGKGLTRIETDISLIKKLLNLMYLAFSLDEDQEKLRLTNDLLDLMANY